MEDEDFDAGSEGHTRGEDEDYEHDETREEGEEEDEEALSIGGGVEATPYHLHQDEAQNVLTKKMEHLAAVDPDEVLQSYTYNTAEENLVLDYLDNFRRQFTQLFPGRADLLLAPRNECGVPKCVCSTVRPTQLPYKDLYDLSFCSKFIADFLEYEPLSDPLKLPLYLPSPLSTLSWQLGDCLDFAVTLTSLLIGGGYDAYCVSGYAPRSICLADQSHIECPELRDDGDGNDSVVEAATTTSGSGTGRATSSGSMGGVGLGNTDRPGTTGSANAGEGNNNNNNNGNGAANGNGSAENKKPYAVKPRPTLHSSYILKHERLRILNEESKKAEHEVRQVEEEDIEEPDHLEGKRVHCWVLVLAGKREISSDLFIEPSTGTIFPTSNSPYFGIETVWNNKNIWVNMQDPKIPVKNLRLDLNDVNRWEFVFLDSSKAGNDKDNEEESTAAIAAAAAAAAATAAAGGNTPGGTDSAGGARAEGGGGGSAGGTGVGGSGARTTVKWEHGGLASGEEIKDTDKVIDLPPSWVPRLEINRDAYLARCAHGVKIVKYRKAKVEKFSESSRADGMVSRLTIFLDLAQTKIGEIRETFGNRRDRLQQRTYLPAKHTRIDHFAKGRLTPDALKEIIETPDSREFIFYSSARLDGMVKRTELFGSKIFEVFENRDDRLNYRSLTYEKPGDTNSANNNAAAIAAARARNPTGEVVRKMCEKFDRNAEVEADSDVRRRVFLLTEGKIILDFHYAKGNVTAASRVFSKDGKSVSYSSDPFAKQPRSSALRDQFQRLLQAEKECTQAMRDSDRAAKELLALRKKEEDNTVLNKSLYEQLKQKQAEEAEKPAEEEVETGYKNDYLAPYLPKGKKSNLTRVEAMAAKDACLNALRERLIDRSHIIESRLEEEQQQLARRQAGYQRQDKDKTAEEEYEKYVQEATFRIQILKQRRDRHDEMAKQKFKDMINTLAQDPRLAVLNERR